MRDRDRDKDSFTDRLTARLLGSIWQDLLQTTEQAIRWERFICDADIRMGDFYFYITLYDDDTSEPEVEICKEDEAGRLADKRLPNITASLAAELKGFWQYAADRVFLGQIDEARGRIRKYETEHHIQSPETPNNSNDRRQAYSTPSNFNDEGHGGKIYHKRNFRRSD